jgi:hypothetical protein
MSVVIVNMTGNRCGFENGLCASLDVTITADSELRVARGEDLVNGAINLPGDCRVLVVVAHAGVLPDQSVHIDMGIQPPCATAEAFAAVGREISCPCHECSHATAVRQSESPTVLAQLILAQSPFVLVFCACEALAPDTMAIPPADHRLGTVASHQPVGLSDVQRVAKIVDDLDVAIASDVSDSVALQLIVQEAVSSTPGDAEFHYTGTMWVVEE